MLNRKKILNYILYAFGEIALIVIGILLALYLQNKNESNKTEESVKTSVAMLKDEIIINKQNIESVKDYHIMLRDTINSLKIHKSDTVHSPKFWQGMRTPRLQNAAFQTSIQSDIGKAIHPKLLKTLNSLYTYQEDYNDYTSQSRQVFFSADFTDINNFKKIIATIGITMTDLYFYENDLIKMYDNSLKQIDSLYQ